MRAPRTLSLYATREVAAYTLMTAMVRALLLRGASVELALLGHARRSS